MHHAVIMAGGSGTRLWPLSREDRPKQLLKLFGGKSLLRLAFERLSGLLPPEQIYVITGRRYLDAVAGELPEVPRDNLFGEPCPRDTAPAVGLAAHLLALRDPQGTMGIFTADQVIEPAEEFRETVGRAFNAAERHPGCLVTFGVRPTAPHTGYGYIHRGKQIAPGVHEIRAFREKPDLLTAGMYVAGGDYLWNAGMFVWRIPTILEQFEKLQPAMSRELQAVAADLGRSDRADANFERFSNLQKISVDFAIMEKAPRVICVEMACRWLDVGSWPSLGEIYKSDDAGNTVAAPNAVAIDSRNNIVVSESDHLVALIGVKDMVVVHGENATLVCPRNDAQRIKELVERIKKKGMEN